jgi:myosin-1
LRGSAESALKAYQLSRDPDAYFYTQQGKSSKVNTINDGSDYKATNSAFKTLGFSTSEIDTIWNIVAAILHLVSKKFFQMYIKLEILVSAKYF